MQYTSLDNLLSGNESTPYTKSIRVKVVAVDEIRQYKSDQGEDRQVLNAAVADRSKGIKAVVYDASKFNRFRDGNCLIIRNVIKKPNAIVVTTMTKIFPTADFQIPEEIVKKAMEILHPPPAAIIPLREAVNSPTKTKVSVVGKIVQEEVPYEVQVRNEKVKVRQVYLSDTTSDKVKVSLWRDLTAAETKPGSYIKITNVVVNNYKQEVSLSSTSLTSIESTEAPEEDMVVIVQACTMDDDNTATLLSDKDEVMSVSISLLQDLFPDVSDLELHITTLTPLCMTCTYKGGEIVALQIGHA